MIRIKILYFSYNKIKKTLYKNKITNKNCVYIYVYIKDKFSFH